MKHADEYRNPIVAHQLIEAIRGQATEPIQIMEFCGGHTHAIMRYGLRQAMAPQVRMLSGPGCPVCVTDNADIDRAIAWAELPGVTVATFGDLIRVPGTHSSLQEARARGGDVQIVYSALDAVEMARQAPGRSIVMLGIGFETTAPAIAASVLAAEQSHVKNYSIYSMHKLTPPAMRAILDAGEVRIDAVLGPGHVTTITGWHAWDFLAEEYGISCAVSGFEPLDILQAIKVLVEGQGKEPRVVNAYTRGTTAEGNRVAQSLMGQVFQVSSAAWRGLGEIPGSGFVVREEYAAHDALKIFDLPPMPVESELSTQQRACRCGEVLRGLIEPPACPLFRTVCMPARPIGPCMVSAEGACAAYYRYGGSTD